MGAVPRPQDPALLDRHARLGRRLATPHLPQGAPTSPALASLAARRLDLRLAGLASALGARYSRYADDLTFSGDADLPAGRWGRVVSRVAREEGFAVAAGKSSVDGCTSASWSAASWSTTVRTCRAASTTT